jgi:phage FluMu gp28-like protein
MPISYVDAYKFATDLLKRSLLTTSDFTQLNDNSYDAEEWATWRQQIRDLVLTDDDGWFEFPDPPNDSLGAYLRDYLFDAHLLGLKDEQMEINYEELKSIGMAYDESNGNTL